MRRVALVLCALVLGIYLALAGLLWWLRADALRTGRAAVSEFGGDEVTALLALVQSPTHTLRERNAAVHALAQIGDPRALRVLGTYYTGGPCDHARFLCQRELGKAMDRCNGRNWAPRWLPLLPRAPTSAAPRSS